MTKSGGTTVVVKLSVISLVEESLELPRIMSSYVSFASHAAIFCVGALSATHKKWLACETI